MNKEDKIILIVDDDATNIFALTALLKARGYKYLSSRDIEGAYTHLQNEPSIGIVLMDMMMPGVDGYSAIPAIRANNNYDNIPIVAVTAQAMKGDREKCLEAGADDYLAKPINVDALDALIRKFI